MFYFITIGLLFFILIRHTRTQKLSERYWSYCRQRKNKYAGVLEGTDWDSSLQVNLYIWWKVLNVWELSKIDGMIYISFEKKTHHISSLCTQLNCQTFRRVFKGLRSKTVINTCIKLYEWLNHSESHNMVNLHDRKQLVLNRHYFFRFKN